MDNVTGTPKPAINQGTANATVSVKALENIKGEALYYCVIDTLKGRVPISIGERNYKLISELLAK